jgi:hypothetical protein
MTVKPIHSEADYRATLAQIEALWDAAESSEEADGPQKGRRRGSGDECWRGYGVTVMWR